MATTYSARPSGLPIRLRSRVETQKVVYQQSCPRSRRSAVLRIVTGSSMSTTQQRLRDLVQERDPGSRIPSERDLATSWGVARMTLRRAVDVLVTEGILERR